MVPEDYPLPRNQTAVLAHVLLLLPHGYLWYHLQTAPEERVLVALSKLHQKHGVLLSPKDRHARRISNLPVAHVVLSPRPQGGKWTLLLLSTKRLKGESMRKVDDPQHPLTWPAWRQEDWRPTYVLRQDERGRWTWFLTQDFYTQLLEEALYYTQRQDWARLSAHLANIGRLPMFRGVWTQAQEIRRRVLALWGDHHLRHPNGHWAKPPWDKVLKHWPPRPLSPVGVTLHWQKGEGPRTLGDWLRQKGL